MSWSRPIRTICLVAAVGLARAVFAASADPARLVEDGNTAFADERYGEAEEHYADAQRALPESPEVKFDLATARYKLGDLTGARDLYLDALDSPNADEMLRRRTRYNLGNTAFKEAEQRLADGDLAGAVDAYRDSVRLYREAAGGDQRLDDQLARDALWNIEVTRLRIKQILDEIKRQQEQQQQQQQQQEQKDNEFREKLDKAIEEQEQIAEQTEQPEMTDQEREQLDQKQQENLERTKELSDELAERTEQNEANQSKSAGQAEAQEHMRNAQEQLTESQTHQAESCEHMQQDNTGRAHESAEKALENLKKARDELSKKQEQPQPQPEQNQCRDSKCQGQQAKPGEGEGREQKQTRTGPRELTDEEAQRLLEELRAGEPRRREELARQFEREGHRLYDKKQHEQVLRDW